MHRISAVRHHVDAMGFSPTVVMVLGLLAVGMWATLVYLTLLGIARAEIPNASFQTLLAARASGPSGPLRVLLAVDGSPASAAAVQEVAHAPLPAGSAIRVLTVLHSRVPVMPDVPPWGVTAAAVHAESVREQTRHAPEVLDSAVARLQAAQPSVAVTSRTLEGEPRTVILEEAAAWPADRIVLGSHGRTDLARAVLGSTAAGVAAHAPCTVHVVRPAPAPAAAARQPA
ncbi:MAG: universal stress protein [Vicinamibacterales bacterium]